MFCVFCAQRFVPSQRRSDSFPASTRSWSNYVCNLKRLNMLRILSDKDLDSSGTISLEEWVEALVQIRHLVALNWQDRSSQTFCAFCGILRHSATFCSFCKGLCKCGDTPWPSLVHCKWEHITCAKNRTVFNWHILKPWMFHDISGFQCISCLPRSAIKRPAICCSGLKFKV